jgi:hypothetical protein
MLALTLAVMMPSGCEQAIVNDARKTIGNVDFNRFAVLIDAPP